METNPATKPISGGRRQARYSWAYLLQLGQLGSSARLVGKRVSSPVPKSNSAITPFPRHCLHCNATAFPTTQAAFTILYAHEVTPRAISAAG